MVVAMKFLTTILILTLSWAMPALATSVTIAHALGETTLEKNPQRVVVLGVGALDMLTAFGIDPIATSQDYLPEYLEKYTQAPYASAGTIFEPDFEGIYTLKPDVIFIGPRAAKGYKDLSKIAPTIVISPSETGSYWESTQQQWRNLAAIFEISDRVETTIQRLDKEFKAIHQFTQTHPSSALTVMSAGGVVTAFSEDSRFGSSIYMDFGFTQAAPGLKTKRHGDVISFEFINKVNPAHLIILDADKLRNQFSSRTKEEFSNPLIEATLSYKNDNILYVDMNAWYLAMGGVVATERMLAEIKQLIDSPRKG